MSSKRTQRQFSVEEVAKNIINVHPNVISRFLDSGELGYYKRPDRRLIGEYHLLRFLKRAERGELSGTPQKTGKRAR